MKYKAVIFDLDGVICHTDHYHYLAWKQLADQMDILFDETINNSLRGVSRMDSLEIILKNYNKEPLSIEKKEALVEEKNDCYKELLKQMSPKDLQPEIWDTLEQLRKMGIKLAIGSSSKNASFILERLGLGGYFDALSDGNHISNSKPHPEVFLKAADQLGINPSFCLVVEDAKAGVDAAQAAGMDSAAVGDAVKYLASYDLKKFSDLVELCKE